MISKNGGGWAEFHVGSKPLFAAMLGVAFGASPVVYNVMPLIIGPIHDDYGWSFSTISAGITFYGVLGALLAPSFGYLVDRFGVRSVVLASLLLFGLFFSLLGIIPKSLTAFFGVCFLLGLVTIGSSPVTFSRLVSSWFVQRRGLALGLMLLGTGITGFLVPHLTRFTLLRWDWQTAAFVAVLPTLAVALPFCILWFREPREHVYSSQGGPSSHFDGVSLGDAVRRRRFWLLFISIFLVSTAYAGAYIHLGEIVYLHGFDVAVAATAISVMAAGILVGRVTIGLLFDYLWAPAVAAPPLILGGIGCLLLMGSELQYPLVLLSGFALGMSSGAEADSIAYMTGRYFGMRHYGRIYGCLFVPYGIGASISPSIYGAVRDATGNYDSMLLAAFVLYAFGAALLLCLGRYPESFRSGRAPIAEATNANLQKL